MSKHSIEKMKSLASARSGKCLSRRYIDNKASLKWKCSLGHIWIAQPASILRGSWCPVCARKGNSDKRRATIEQARLIARQRRGSCLSVHYSDSKEKLLWRCERGHEWEAGFSAIKYGSWCPSCRGGIAEEICRKYFEAFLGVPFKKVKPKWLTTIQGGRLELDGFNQDLKLAFEYHGRQHFEKNKLMTRSSAALAHRKSLDILKRKLCRQNGIKLLEIPHTVGTENLGAFIKEKLKGYRLKRQNFSVRRNSAALPNLLAAAVEHANAIGGICLSKRYIDSKHDLLWKCAKGHKWYASFNNVVSKQSWCPNCAGTARKDIEDMRAIARGRLGACLSRRYIGLSSKLKWRCKLGHVWLASYDSVRKGSWCLYCSKRAPILAGEMQSLAKKKGGKFLSRRIESSMKPLKWQCKRGHIWKASANNVKNNHSWCPVCARQKL